jgi:hypothetical protein
MLVFGFVGAVAAVQFTNAFLLWVFGYPSIVSKYLEGFHTKNPRKWYDHVFNVVFWLFISIAYFSYRKVDKRYGFLKTRLYYALAIILSFLVFAGFILPLLARIVPEHWYT